MSERTLLAVPSMGAGGLEAERSGHFGHCDCFTLVDLVAGAVCDVQVIANPPHEGCLRPVALLEAHGVTALLAAGMGARPLAGFAAAGIDVYYEAETPNVGDAVQRVIAGAVEPMGLHQVCGGDGC